MKKILIESTNEVSHNLLIDAFSNQGINFSQRILSDASFPSVSGTAYAEISISYKYLKEVEAVLEALSEEDYRLRITNDSSGKGKFSRIALIVYSIVVTLLLFKYWHINYLNTIDKNFVIKWNHSNVALSYTDKKNGKLVSRFIDENYDNNFERFEGYVNSIGPSTVSLDKDENGYYEETFFFDFYGKPTGMGIDKDADGSFDYYELITDENDTLKFEDKNHNGRMEWSNKKQVTTTAEAP